MFRDKYLVTCLLIAGIAIGLIEDRIEYTLVSAGFLIGMLLFERVQRVRVAVGLEVEGDARRARARPRRFADPGSRLPPLPTENAPALRAASGA